MGDEASQAAKPRALRSFISRFRSEILVEWKRIARAIPVASDLPAIALEDTIPDLLDQTAEIAERFADDTTTPKIVDTARRHAVDRLGAGFDVGAVVHELSILRGCMLAVWDREHQGRESSELRALNLAFDRAIAESVARYVEARDRTLSAIDTISNASLEATSLHDLLHRLLQVFMSTTESVHTCAIMLREEDDKLHTRAAVGLEQELEIAYMLAKGDGFAGRVWAEAKPVELRSAYMHPIVKSPAIRDKSVRALYGIPLMQGGELIGIAHMGSLTASQFAEEDKQLFRSMCARATVGIYHHMLRDRLTASEARFKNVANERERALGKLEALLAAAPVGIAFVDRDLRYLRINDALAAMNGRPAAEHIGRTIGEMLPDAASAVLVPRLRAILDTGEPIVNLELHADHERTFLATYFPIHAGGPEVTGVGGIVVDVTAMRRAQAAVANSEARLKAIVEHAPVAIYVKDEAGNIVLTNERTAEALGRSRDELLGHRGDEIVPAEFEREHRAHDLEVMRSGQVVEGEEVVPGARGERTFLTVKFPIPGGGGRTFVCGISTEITERKRMEEELRAAVRAQDEVLAIVSHDLRNPLATIQLSAAAIAARIEDPRHHRHLDMIQRSCMRMTRLIGDLLDAATIERKGLQLDRVPVGASEVVNEACDLNDSQASDKRLTLRRECNTDDEVLCDRDRLLQVFGNLIGNSIKFCRPGDTITVSCDVAADQIRFSVTDTGPGIPAEALPHVFDPHWSAPEHATLGSGLGLYIARGIIEAHGGGISVATPPAGGTVFSFTLPR